MKEIIVNSIKLCLITLIAGLCLGCVYEVTKEPRKEQELKAKQEAYKNVFDKADSFEKIEYDSKAMEAFLKSNGVKNSTAVIGEIVEALDGQKNKIGYVITVTDKEGYGGDITFTLGIKNDGTINGISYLSIGETAGVGMKATEQKFTNQFVGKTVPSFEYSKSGASADNQIDAISGATVTTNAVTNGVNAGILAFNFIIDGNQEEGGETNE